jgi:NTE family protein
MVAEGATVSALDAHIVQPFLATIRSSSFIRAWVSRLALLPLRKLRDGAYTRTSLAADLFGAWFYDDTRCSELPNSPYLILNASNLLSGRAWRFTRDGLGDSRMGYARWGDAPLPLGFAVGASAAFPPVFPPARVIAGKYDFSGSVYGEAAFPPLKYVPLSDGGVYENMGIEVLTKQTQIPDRILAPAEFVLASDGGYPAQHRFRASGLPAIADALLLYRVDEIARDQVSALRRRLLIQQFQRDDEFSGALVVLGSAIAKLPTETRQQYIDQVGASALIPPKLLARIHAMRTHLNAFTAAECEALMYHGYTLLDAALWAHEESHPARFRTKHPGAWRIIFTSEKVRQWEAGFSDS